MFSQVAQRFAYSHFPAIIAPPRAVEQLEMQQSGLQRGFRLVETFSAPAMWTFGFQLRQPHGARGAKVSYMLAALWSLALAGELRRDDSGQVKFDRELRSQVDSAYGARER